MEKRVKLEEIHVRGQYGISYKATWMDGGADKVNRVNFVPGEKEDLEGTHFVKCPDPKLTREKQEQFVEKEFENGTSINHVVERLAARGSKAGATVFTLNRMIGRGMLHHKRAREAQPCLIYEYAGNREKTNHSLDTQWERKFAEGRSKDWLPENWKIASDHFLDFADHFARAVQVLHNQGMVHTFLVPRNIIWDPARWSPSDESIRLTGLFGQFTIVGFGYSRHADASGRWAESQARTGTSIERNEAIWRPEDEDNWFRAPECRNDQNTHAAIGYPADIYSIGAILYFLLLPRENKEVGEAEAMEVLKHPPTDSNLLKRRVAESLRKHQRELLRVNENVIKIIDTCLRYDAENRYSCVEELIEAISIARKANSGKTDGDDVPSDTDTGQQKENVSEQIILDNFVERVSEFEFTAAIKQQYFRGLKESLATDLGQQYGGLHRGHFEVYGHRDRVVASLCRLIASAKSENEYRTMTLPDYWTDSNLGSLGRFLTMNKHMARCGVKIDRLFLVSEDFHNLPEEQQVVLENQLSALRDLQEEGGTASQNLLLKVLKVPEETIADFERNGELVAYLGPIPAPGMFVREGKVDEKEEEHMEKVICLNFFSTARETWRNGKIMVRRTIKKARYWNPVKVKRGQQFKNSLMRFQKYLNTAKLLEDYIAPEGQPSPPSEIDLDRLLRIGPKV